MISKYFLVWASFAGTITGPAVENYYLDLTRDGYTDLRDVAEFQNGFQDECYFSCEPQHRQPTYRACCPAGDHDCSSSEEDCANAVCLQCE